MVICFFVRRLLELHVFSSFEVPKLDRSSWETLKCQPGFQGEPQSDPRRPRSLSQGRTLILGCISLRSPGVSWSNEIFSRERWGAPLSRGESTDLTPSSLSKCNSPVVSSPLSVAGQNKEGRWLVERDGVNMAKPPPPTDRRHAHWADKVERLSGHTHTHTGTV